MKTIILSLAILLFSSVSLLAQEECTGQPEETLYANIDATQSLDTINAYVDKNWFVILDVRTPNEYDGVHIEEGVNLDYNSANFTTELEALDRNKVYLVHCASGGRSGAVYTQMQNLDFYRVYNMTGGLNSWDGSGYPTTTDVAAIVASCETEISFEHEEVGGGQMLVAKITNAGNDTLRVLEYTDLSDTDFDTDFDADLVNFSAIIGSKEVSFYFFYQPTDEIDDNVTFSITTNGGVIDFELSGTAEYPVSVLSNVQEEISIYQDQNNKQINILGNTQAMEKYSLISISGMICKSGRLEGETQINYSDLSSGIYILRINSDVESKTYKLMLE